MLLRTDGALVYNSSRQTFQTFPRTPKTPAANAPSQQLRDRENRAHAFARGAANRRAVGLSSTDLKGIAALSYLLIMRVGGAGAAATKGPLF